MNSIDEQLDLLFRAAGARSIDTVPPFGLGTRVLAAWRAVKPVNLWSTALLLRGLLIACVIMVLSFLPLFQKDSDPISDYVQLADSALQVSSTP
jgi:hypothetical protein